MGGYGLVNIRYACGHDRLFRFPYPEVGETVWCVTCEVSTEVTSDTIKEWITKCTQCRFTRYSGQSKLDADYHSARHRISRGHISTVSLGVSKQLLKQVRIYPTWKGKL